MVKNTLDDLRNHLFAQLERLGDDEAMENAEQREREIARSQAIVSVSSEIVNSARAQTEFLKMVNLAGKNGTDASFFVNDKKQLEEGKS